MMIKNEFEIEKTVFEIIEKSKSIVVKDKESYIESSEFLKAVKSMKNEVSITFDPIVRKTYEAHKEATKQRKKFLDPLLKIEEELKVERTWYINECKRKEREEQERLLRLEKEKEEKKRKTLEEKIEKAIEEGDKNKADKFIEKINSLHDESIKIPAMQSKNFVTEDEIIKEKWYAEVYNLPEFIKGISEGKSPTNFVLPNKEILDKQAQCLKDSFSYPGVRFLKKIIICSKPR